MEDRGKMEGRYGLGKDGKGKKEGKKKREMKVRKETKEKKRLISGRKEEIFDKWVWIGWEGRAGKVGWMGGNR